MTTPTPMPSPAATATPTPASDPMVIIEPLSGDGIATIVAAILAAAIALIGYSIQQSTTRKERRATIYSEALRAVEDYLEAPYLVRRRDGSNGSRQNVTTQISEIQSRLSYYCALLDLHAHTQISNAYSELVRTARSEAGPAMSAAWKTRPTTKDKNVPLGQRFERTRSDAARRAVIAAIRRHDGRRMWGTSRSSSL